MKTRKRLTVIFAVVFTILWCQRSLAERLFPVNLPANQWHEFAAEGYNVPVSGVIYHPANPPSCGMPLGAVDTGCVDLEVNGTFGYRTIFNYHVPREGKLNIPYLGINVNGQTWVLTTNSISGVQNAGNIHYWGHYPIADMEYETTSPIGIGLRAWAPFIPGRIELSTIPAAVFEVHLRNDTASAQNGSVALSIPGYQSITTARTSINSGDVKGVKLSAGSGYTIVDYTLAAIDEVDVRTGDTLGASGSAWATINTALPNPSATSTGASIAVDFSIPAGVTKVVRFLMTWHAPYWMSGGTPSSGGNAFKHMYSRQYNDSAQTVLYAAAYHDVLLRHIIAWQKEVYTTGNLPGWLKDSLINMLHLITETGMWAQALPPIGNWCNTEDGLWGVSEAPRSCAQIECIPDSWYRSTPFVYFFPKLALSTLRGYKQYQDAEGAPPWIFGGRCTSGGQPCDFVTPDRGYQVTTNGSCYVDMFNRYITCYPMQADALLAEFYDSIKACTSFTMGLNSGPDGVISMPDHRVSIYGMPWETELFEWYHWEGMATHVGGMHLAQLQMTLNMANRTGDAAYAQQCANWLAAGKNSMETKMWNGTYYLNFWDPAQGIRSDHVMAYQLGGEWMAKSDGLESVFDPNRVDITLNTIAQINVPLTNFGALNYAHSDGTILASGEYPMAGSYAPYDFFSAELFMLGMTYMYYGDGEFGLELVRRCINAIVNVQGSTWDQPNIVRGDTGQRQYGEDYSQNLMLWSLPAAMAGQDITGPMQEGGLVNRILNAKPCPRYDLDDDCVVDINDLLIVAQNWLGEATL